MSQTYWIIREKLPEHEREFEGVLYDYKYLKLLSETSMAYNLNPHKATKFESMAEARGIIYDRNLDEKTTVDVVILKTEENRSIPNT
jgi:hypothetical protein